MSLRDALDALGECGTLGEGHSGVAIDAIIGSIGRADDFDRHFRLLNPTLRSRLDLVTHGENLPPVRLVQLGDAYFVDDGHHRIAAAHHYGHAAIPAHVRTICTTIHANCCLHPRDLPSKAAQRARLQSRTDTD